jgi:hypothetical protein
VAYRTVALGTVVGCSLSALRVSRSYLVGLRDERAAAARAAAADGEEPVKVQAVQLDTVEKT